MFIIQILGCLLFLSAVITARTSKKGVTGLQDPSETASSTGSLILHYDDNTSYRINYHSASQYCKVNNLPNKKITKVVVNAAEFILYIRRGWKGPSELVRSVGSREYSVKEIGIRKVKSVKQYKCGAASLLELVKLSDSPLAKCNDGSTAVYYRPPAEKQSSNKWMIYLKGGGYCVPGSPLTDITNCNIRCSTEPDLCTASTDPDLDLTDSGLGDNIGSNDPGQNPAFYDFNKVWIPYCSSDVYSGTRDSSADTDNRVFHGKYIIQAVIADLISSTQITTAEQVVMIGTSAGAAGTELNCDYLADELHKVNPNIDVRCVSDSGTLHPPSTFSQHCRAEVLEETFFTAWNGVPDQSCLDQAQNRLDCLSTNTAYPYLSSPMMLLTSATDSNTFLELCTEGNFASQWALELETVARNISQAKPTMGMYVVNCPFHVAVVFPNSYTEMEVPLLDSTGGEQKMSLKALLANFVKGTKPFQAIDDMTAQNPKCEE